MQRIRIRIEVPSQRQEQYRSHEIRRYDVGAREWHRGNERYKPRRRMDCVAPDPPERQIEIDDPKRDRHRRAGEIHCELDRNARREGAKPGLFLVSSQGIGEKAAEESNHRGECCQDARDCLEPAGTHRQDTCQSSQIINLEDAGDDPWLHLYERDDENGHDESSEESGRATDVRRIASLWCRSPQCPKCECQNERRDQIRGKSKGTYRDWQMHAIPGDICLAQRRNVGVRIDREGRSKKQPRKDEQNVCRQPS
jgi:hypothetical protein